LIKCYYYPGFFLLHLSSLATHFPLSTHLKVEATSARAPSSRCPRTASGMGSRGNDGALRQRASDVARNASTRLGHDDRPESLAGGLRRGSGLAVREEGKAQRGGGVVMGNAMMRRIASRRRREMGGSNGRGGVYARTRSAHRNERGAGGRKAAAVSTMGRSEPSTFYIAAFSPRPQTDPSPITLVQWGGQQEGNLSFNE
jgi:hypothetical protein